MERRFRRRLLGEYSDEKYEEFIKATGVSDLSDKDNSEISALLPPGFVYYLREQRDNGNEMRKRTDVRCSTESISTLNPMRI